MTVQPVQEVGRVEDYDRIAHRLTLTEVRRKILEQSDVFEEADLMPVPCHPDALAMAYAVKQEGTVRAVTRFLDRDVAIAGAANTIIFERSPEVLSCVTGCFSTGIGPSEQAEKLHELLCCLPTIDAPDLTYENVFRVMVVYFQDAYDFDVQSAKRSCIHFAQPDGRLIPFETYNIFYRDPEASGLHRIRKRTRRVKDSP